MDYLKSYHTELKKEMTESRLQNQVNKKILSQEKEIVNLVRNRWRKGERPSGSIIGTYANKEYRQDKMEMNPQADGFVDLILTGDLNEALKLYPAFDTGFTIFSADEKATKIADKYGLDVYGLTDDEGQKIIDEAATGVLNDMMQKLW